MKIELSKERKVILVQEQSVMAKTIEVLKIIEIPGRLVQAIVKCTGDEREEVETIILWEGKDYKPLGTYNENDVKTRLQELL